MQQLKVVANNREIIHINVFLILSYKSTITFVDLCGPHTNLMVGPANLMVDLLNLIMR